MTVQGTSCQAHAEISTSQRKYSVDLIYDIVAAAVRNGAIDMSLREIAHTYERIHGKRIDVGTVSARVTNLVTAQRLVRLPNADRACTLSGKTVSPVTVVAKQARMF